MNPPPEVKNMIRVVDDDPKIVAALTIRLKAAGYEVSSAPDGIEGLKLAVRLRPDLILSARVMPAPAIIPEQPE